MRTFDGLRRAIIERPDDVDAYLVLADFLQEHGDPRGELIALEHRASIDPGAKEPAQHYFEAHREALMGPMIELEPYLTAVRWELGFVRDASLHFPSDEPMQNARRITIELLEAPSMALVQELRIMVSGDVQPDPNNDLDRAVVMALCGEKRPSIRLLELSVMGAGRVSMKLLSEALPNVATFNISSKRISFGGMKAVGVRELGLFTSLLPVSSFASVDWRALESLSVTASIDGSLTELLTATPMLRTFAIRTDPKNVEIVGSLVESGIAARLSRLRIDPIGLRELGALMDSAHRFKSLERLEVPKGHDKLAPHFPNVNLS
jgi:uncharacterized protein (TIGR02996 family)